MLWLGGGPDARARLGPDVLSDFGASGLSPMPRPAHAVFDGRASTDAGKLFSAQHVERARAADLAGERNASATIRRHPSDDRGVGPAGRMPEQSQRRARRVRWRERHETSFVRNVKRIESKKLAGAADRFRDRDG